MEHMTRRRCNLTRPRANAGTMHHWILRRTTVYDILLQQCRIMKHSSYLGTVAKDSAFVYHASTRVYHASKNMKKKYEIEKCINQL
jgi:hypothetical protein